MTYKLFLKYLQVEINLIFDLKFNKLKINFHMSSGNFYTCFYLLNINSSNIYVIILSIFLMFYKNFLSSLRNKTKFYFSMKP